MPVPYIPATADNSMISSSALSSSMDRVPSRPNSRYSHRSRSRPRSQSRSRNGRRSRSGNHRTTATSSSSTAAGQSSSSGSTQYSNVNSSSSGNLVKWKRRRSKLGFPFSGYLTKTTEYLIIKKQFCGQQANQRQVFEWFRTGAICPPPLET